jgi:hypothetical protein
VNPTHGTRRTLLTLQPYHGTMGELCSTSKLSYGGQAARGCGPLDQPGRRGAEDGRRGRRAVEGHDGRSGGVAVLVVVESTLCMMPMMMPVSDVSLDS